MKSNKAKPMPSMEVLEALFQLDRERGVLIRKREWKQHKAGQVCGTAMKSGHLQTMVEGKRYLVHRIVYFMATGVDPLDMRVDHINGITDDNRPENLRLASQAENCRHKVRLCTTNTSGHRNVSWNKTWGKWQVSMTVRGKRVSRMFVGEDEAIRAAQAMRAEHYGEFAGVAP